MKILYVLTGDIYQNTSGNIRNAALITGLNAIGHEVITICISSGKKADERIKKIIDSSTKVHIVGQEEVSNSLFSTTGSVKKIRKLLKRMLLKTYNHFQIYDPYKRRIKLFNKNNYIFPIFDVVISSSDPRSSHLFAQKIMKECGISVPWLQYWGDPMANDVSANSIMKLFIANKEKKLISMGDKIIYTNPLTVNHMRKTYPQLSEKIRWIPTSYVISQDSEVHDTKINQELVLGYFGDYVATYRDIRPLVEAVHKEKRQLIICGSGDANIESNDYITVYKRLSLDEMLIKQAQCDVFVVIENKPRYDKNSNNLCIQVPGKLYHYALSDKYVLVVCETQGIRDNYDRYGRYIFCNNNAESIAIAIKDIENGKYLETRHYSDEFSPESVANEFLSQV